jgi:hypothetical protein
LETVCQQLTELVFVFHNVPGGSVSSPLTMGKDVADIVEPAEVMVVAKSFGGTVA